MSEINLDDTMQKIASNAKDFFIDYLMEKKQEREKSIDEIILFIMEEDQAFSDDDTCSSDNFSSQIVQKLENLKKGN